MIAMTQPMLSSGRLFCLIFQGPRVISLHWPGYRSKGMMCRWQATLYVLLMISESQDKEVSEYVKLAIPSVHGRATSVYRTLYESLGLRLGRNGLELGLAGMSVSLLRKSGTA